MSGLLRDLIFLILQFLREENYKEAAHRLESESGVFFDVNYIEELVIKGDWDNLEKYLAGFICVGDNRYSVKMLFEIRKQKYLEALDKNEGAKAFEILNEELKVFKPDGELFSEMANLFMLENIRHLCIPIPLSEKICFRENAQLSTYTDDVTARGVLASELKKLIEKNPELCHKCQLPTVNNSRLRLLVNQSLNWQHQLCQNPNSVPDITSILVDHLCGPQNAAQGQVHVANEFNSIRRSGGLQLPPTSNVASSLPPGAILALPARVGHVGHDGIAPVYPAIVSDGLRRDVLGTTSFCGSAPGSSSGNISTMGITHAVDGCPFENAIHDSHSDQHSLLSSGVEPQLDPPNNVPVQVPTIDGSVSTFQSDNIMHPSYTAVWSAGIPQVVERPSVYGHESATHVPIVMDFSTGSVTHADDPSASSSTIHLPAPQIGLTSRRARRAGHTCVPFAVSIEALVIAYWNAMFTVLTVFYCSRQKTSIGS
ncbi:CTLH, C-terminal LisH motif-containing protein [Artemisia annua]|uniref:CTLH, C-terminal LisH motif-containing protein n=1 Tax=Artemisia annua TaxID=35608 RepID=A0A2U1QIA5_ARTAN|nr:CTLH, C-terminal LisH motif-containing protein [Artemisia annua]